MHDPRIGRFFALDPLMAQYPHNSPYAFSENNVIHAVELEGLEKEPVNELREAFAYKPEQKVVNYYLVIYANQPENGEPTMYVEGGQFGHAFVALTVEYEDGSRVRRHVGFYPDAGPEGPNTFSLGVGAGEVKVEDGTRWNVRRSKKVTKEGFMAALNKIEEFAVVEDSEYSDNRSEYHLQEFNCTDFACEVYNASGGEQVSTETQDFEYLEFKGSAKSPGQLGEDLKTMGNSGTTIIEDEDTKSYPEN